MFINVINSYRHVVAVCDSEILGKYFEEDKFQLDVKESFFKGEKKTDQEIIKIMQDMKREDATFNIIGEKATKVAIEAGIISEDSVNTIQGVPFALVLM